MEKIHSQKIGALANSINTEDEEKKTIRKEIERQRRQQMSSLLASLRSQLPPESIKGKRSTCDLINEAVNYINYQKNNIQELSSNRDILKQSFDSTVLKHEIGSSGHRSLSCVTVRPCFGGVEIVTTIRYEPGEEGFLLSKVLEVVLEEGLDVVHCFSTKKDDAFYVNNIHCQASNLACIDLARLQQKLIDMAI